MKEAESWTVKRHSYQSLTEQEVGNQLTISHGKLKPSVHTFLAHSSLDQTRMDMYNMYCWVLNLKAVEEFVPSELRGHIS